MKKLICLVVLAACGKSAAPQEAPEVEVVAVDAAEAVSAPDVVSPAAAVSPADAPSAVTP